MELTVAKIKTVLPVCVGLGVAQEQTNFAPTVQEHLVNTKLEALLKTAWV